jgi:hypothetical protein
VHRRSPSSSAGTSTRFETISKWQRSKRAHLELLERHALGKSNALTLTSAALIDHVRSRRAKGAGPATVANDLIWIGVVLRAANSVREKTDLSGYSQAHLDRVALKLNQRPRETLGFQTPADKHGHWLEFAGSRMLVE